MIKVYHITNRELFREAQFQYEEGKMSDFAEGYMPGDLELVAEVDTDDLDVAYRLTNHIHDSWTKNEGVKCHVQKARSTSMGDIMITDVGGKFVVASFGFEAVLPF